MFIICFSMNHTEREGKSVLLHNLLVVYCIANIDIGIKWGTWYSRIEVKYIWWLGWVEWMQVWVHSLDKGRFSGTCHSDGNDHYRLFCRRCRRWWFRAVPRSVRLALTRTTTDAVLALASAIPASEDYDAPWWTSRSTEWDQCCIVPAWLQESRKGWRPQEGAERRARRKWRSKHERTYWEIERL